MLEWTDENQRLALNEGWSLVHTKSMRRSKRWVITIGLRFANVYEVYGFLVQRAMEKSPVHTKALAVLYQGNKAEFLVALKALPANQTGALIKTIHLMCRVSG